MDMVSRQSPLEWPATASAEPATTITSFLNVVLVVLCYILLQEHGKCYHGLFTGVETCAVRQNASQSAFIIIHSSQCAGACSQSWSLSLPSKEFGVQADIEGANDPFTHESHFAFPFNSSYALIHVVVQSLIVTM